MNVLLEWAGDNPARSFLVRKSGACFETRWRVSVWEKPEGERVKGVPGHGYAETYAAAIEMAISNWENQVPDEADRDEQFYKPYFIK